VRALFSLTLILLLIPALALGGDDAKAPEGKNYGKAMTDADIVPISRIMAKPDDFVGKTVKVSGRVISVCAKRGCWMELAGDEEFQSMRIKVEDGVIVFPMDAIGHEAVAEGVFTKHDLTLEQTQAMAKHACEEKGEKFDPAQVTECAKVYQIAGLGAVIY